MKPTRKNMKQNVFTYLPPEIIVTEILSRLSARTVLSCKCVCKLWRDLIETREFAKSHLSKSSSVCGVALTIRPEVMHKAIELTHMLDDDLHLGALITKLSFTSDVYISGSADGLLLLLSMADNKRYSELYLCNPITREYLDLESPYPYYNPGKLVIYGFGVSRSGQYKVVRIFHCFIENLTKLARPKSDCGVYTVGSGAWRSIAPHAPFHYAGYKTGAFLNGNLPWFVHDHVSYTPWISCFDLETEVFNTCSPPPLRDTKSNYVILTVLEGKHLCMCEFPSNDGIVIWLMKEYGVNAILDKTMCYWVN